MSISDMIVVMSAGEVQQIGWPQDVYDKPANLFVAKFLGTPPINVFDGSVKGGKVYIGDAMVMDAQGVPDQDVYVGIRPEGFLPDEAGPLTCKRIAVQVMGRDSSVVATHPNFHGEEIRAIIDSETKVDPFAENVSFRIRESKTHLFNKETEERIIFGEEE